MRWILRGGVALVVAIAALVLTFGRPADDLPDAASGDPALYSSERGSVYVVEIATRPDYRLIEHDLDTGRSTSLFIVPETGVISSVDRSSDGGSLAMAYTTDYTTPGSGLYLLETSDGQGDAADAAGGEELLVPILAERPGGFFEDIALGHDDALLWATLEEDKDVAVVGVDVMTGEIVQRIAGGVEPAVGRHWVAYLIVEPDGSRRSIGLLDIAADSTSTIEILDARYDLGNLIADGDRNRLLFTAFVPEDQSVIQIGDAAGAHGSHGGPAQWLTLDVASGELARLVDHEPVPVRDATLLSNGEVAALTDEGLVVIGQTVDLIVESRLLGAIAS